MKNKRIIYIAITAIILLICISVPVACYLTRTDDDYDHINQILLNSCGWEIVDEEEIEKYSMLPDGFSGEWRAAHTYDSQYNIPGFIDILEGEYEEYPYIHSDCEETVIYYRFDIRDSQGIIPDSVPLTCTIAYFRDHIAVARVYLDITTLFTEPGIFENQISTSWPLTESKQTILEAAQNFFG